MAYRYIVKEKSICAIYHFQFKPKICKLPQQLKRTMLAMCFELTQMYVYLHMARNTFVVLIFLYIYICFYRHI